VTLEPHCINACSAPTTAALQYEIARRIDMSWGRNTNGRLGQGSYTRFGSLARGPLTPRRDVLPFRLPVAAEEESALVTGRRLSPVTADGQRPWDRTTSPDKRSLIETSTSPESRHVHIDADRILGRGAVHRISIVRGAEDLTVLFCKSCLRD